MENECSAVRIGNEPAVPGDLVITSRNEEDQQTTTHNEAQDIGSTQTFHETASNRVSPKQEWKPDWKE